MLRLIITLVVFMVAGYAAVVAGMVLGQRRLMYFPTHENPAPARMGLNGVSVETVVTVDDEGLVLWYSEADAGQPTLLFFHGNGGEISDRRDRFAAYQDAGLGVVFVSYRGYGGSSGTPTEDGLLTDAVTAYNWLRARGIEASNVVIVGESLGTGVAVQLAAQRPSGALVLGAPYSATDDVAAALYPWLPVRLLMRDRFRSIDHIDAVTAPILIQHGTHDAVVPYEFGQALFQAAPPGATFVTVPQAGHDMLFRPQVWAEEIRFIQNVYASR